MEKIPVKNKNIIWREVKGEGVLLNPREGRYFGLTKVACSFWEKVDGERTTGEIIDLLLKEYDVDKEVLVKDLSELADSLESEKLLSFK